MNKKYEMPRPTTPAAIRREAEVEAGHKCSIAHCSEHTYVDLHHIDGNRENNQIGNVILLCPKHHRMAESGKIDRKSLREYKRLNRLKLGLDEAYILSEDITVPYLNSLHNWIISELERMESSPISSNSIRSHIQPRIKSNGTTLYNFDKLVHDNRHLLFLGNGGSGKTVALLSLLLDLPLQIASNEPKLPVYILLGSLTLKSQLKMLLRAALGRHGFHPSIDEIERLLLQGCFFIVLDGVNEINKDAVEAGAVDDVFNFLDTYSSNTFIISSRYIEQIREINLSKIDLMSWDQSSIHRYLCLRLGDKLGNDIYESLGDDLDYEWLRGSSIAGFCSNPLTLWMLATIVEENKELTALSEDLTDKVVELMIRRTHVHQTKSIPIALLKELISEFAYYMLDAGELLTIPLDKAISIAEHTIHKHNSQLPIPSSLDAYRLLKIFVSTGILRQEREQIIWLHQILQEHLSIAFSSEQFSNFTKLCETLLCPHCKYRADSFYELDGKLIGICAEGGDDFIIPIPQIPSEMILRQKVKLKDKAGFTKLEPSDDSFYLPNSLVDEYFMAQLPLGGMIYVALLSYAQRMKTEKLIDRCELEDKLPLVENLLFDLEVWALVEAGLIRLKHKKQTTIVNIHTPPVNPSARPYGYTLVTLRKMTSEELEEDLSTRIGFTSQEIEQYLEERRRMNLPIYYRYEFGESDKLKVFEIAKKYGGQILRTWGITEENIGEFPGEAWDFSNYATEEQ